MDNQELKFKDVQQAFDSALLLADRGWVKLIAASVLANQLDGPPVWLMIVGASSSGKTEILKTIDDLEFLPGKRISFFISDLTENTLASGFKSGSGEASLLKQMPYGGLLIFKDFTSLLTKRREGRDAIMGQLREVYDRKFDKKTGNGQDVAWTGKVGSLAGVTTAVYEYISEMSVMGDRFVMYTPKQPDRRKLLEFVMAMKVGGDSQEVKMARAKEAMHSYLKRCYRYLKGASLYMLPEYRESLMDIADFATKVRSGVIVDERKGSVSFVPEPEMPTRLIEQLLSVATILSVMHETDGEKPDLTKEDMELLYKIAFDSIPIKRRWALRELAAYSQGVTTAGLATRIGYETEVVKGWLAQLNALRVCRRVSKGMGGADTWQLDEDYREIMMTFEKVQSKDGVLEDESADPDELLADQALRDYGDLEAEFEDQ